MTFRSSGARFAVWTLLEILGTQTWAKVIKFCFCTDQKLNPRRLSPDWTFSVLLGAYTTIFCIMTMTITIKTASTVSMLSLVALAVPLPSLVLLPTLLLPVVVFSFVC